MLLGSHVGMSGKAMLLGSAKEAVSYGANTFMFYTGAPQNTRRKDISELNIDAAWEYMHAQGIEQIVVHAPYIINLGNSVKPETFELAVNFLRTEIERTRACKSHVLILHPGDSGYDIAHDFDGVIQKFDHIIGKERIAVFHINDSKNVCGAAKDRHANIGFGEIGFDALSYIVHHPDFADVPKILETPYIPSQVKEKKSYAPYKYEIEMLKENHFTPDVQEQILRDAEK